jgi:hypothetical protein
MTIQRTTRKPTGLPPWPITLLAGAEKSGKSYAAAEASASDLVGRTFWISVGEDDPDEYGAIPGARFEIVSHDGTYRDILAAVSWCTQQPRIKDKPNLIVIDSHGRFWDLLSDMAQIAANVRAAEKARKYNRPIPTEEAPINSDLWNLARQRWDHVLDALRAHDGPVIVTARLEMQTVFNDNGDPTKDRHQKVKAQKSLPSDVGAIVEMPERGKVFVTGVRSLRWKQTDARVEFPNFTVEALWRKLGLAEDGATAPRQHTRVDAEDRPASEADAARADLAALCDEMGLDRALVAAGYADRAEQPLRDATNAAAIRAFMTDVAADPLPYQKKAA